MDPARRRELVRYAAPVAFLAAVTIAVLLVKSGLNGKSEASPEPTIVSVASAPTTTRTTTSKTASTPTTSARFYTIASGDTLGSVASKENTTVDDLLRLNPGIDPQALHVGQRIRVG